MIWNRRYTKLYPLVNSNNKCGIKNEQRNALERVARQQMFLRMHQTHLRFVSDCRRYLPSRVHEKRSISACVAAERWRNNVAFVGQRNDEARLKRKAKSDWNTLVCPPFFLRFIPASFGSRYHAHHRCFRAFYILYYNKRDMYVRWCECASVNSYRIKILHCKYPVIGEQKCDVILKREISAIFLSSFELCVS